MQKKAASAAFLFCLLNVLCPSSGLNLLHLTGFPIGLFEVSLMLTYIPPESRRIIPTYEKPWLLMLLAFVWFWPGVFSHDLWNPAEPVNFAAIEELSQAKAWLPTVLGQSYFDVSPLYVWLSAGFRTLLSPNIADAYSASRFATVVFMALGLLCCGMAGYRFLGRYHGRSVVLILIGSPGLIVMGHFLGGMSVEFAALGMMLYGWALVKTRVIMASLLLGGGWALLASSAGLLLPLAFIVVALALTLNKHWQRKRYYVTLVGSLSVALPLACLYPFALYQTDLAAFALWKSHHMFGAFGGLETFNIDFSLLYYGRNILWFAFPAWPLALWTIYKRKLAGSDWGVLCIAWLAAVSVLLILSPRQFQDYLVWLLPPLALLGAANLDSLRRGAAAFLNWFGVMTFGLLAFFLWLGFFAMNYGWPAKLAERSAYFSPYYVPDINIMPMAVALLFTPIWLWSITRKHIRGRQAVTNWAAGMTLVWALLMTLFLPWLDAAKSYRPVVEQMDAVLPSNIACIAVAKEARTARLAWSQYSRVDLKVADDSCQYQLQQQTLDTAAPKGWQTVWQGARPRSRNEGFELLQRQQ